MKKLSILVAMLSLGVTMESHANEAFCPSGTLTCSGDVAKCIVTTRNYTGEAQCRGRDSFTIEVNGRSTRITLANPSYVQDASGNEDKCRYTYQPPKPPFGPRPPAMTLDANTICPSGQNKESEQGRDRCWSGTSSQQVDIQLR